MEAEASELRGLGPASPATAADARNGFWEGAGHPRVRDGSYFPSLLEPRRGAERALLAVVQEGT